MPSKAALNVSWFTLWFWDVQGKLCWPRLKNWNYIREGREGLLHFCKTNCSGVSQHIQHHSTRSSSTRHQLPTFGSALSALTPCTLIRSRGTLRWWPWAHCGQSDLRDPTAQAPTRPGALRPAKKHHKRLQKNLYKEVKWKSGESNYQNISSLLYDCVFVRPTKGLKFPWVDGKWSTRNEPFDFDVYLYASGCESQLCVFVRLRVYLVGMHAHRFIIIHIIAYIICDALRCYVSAKMIINKSTDLACVCVCVCVCVE